jgi:hypothetical protein
MRPGARRLGPLAVLELLLARLPGAAVPDRPPRLVAR